MPLDGEAEEIFALPAKQLRMLAINTACIPTLKAGTWVRPGQAYVCTDPTISALWTDPRAQELLVSVCSCVNVFLSEGVRVHVCTDPTISALWTDPRTQELLVIVFLCA